MSRNWKLQLAVGLTALFLCSLCACGTVIAPAETACPASAAVSSAEAEIQRSVEQAVLQHISTERSGK